MSESSRTKPCPAPWKATARGEQQVQQALRPTLLKYKLPTGQELFDRAYGYIRQYC